MRAIEPSTRTTDEIVADLAEVLGDDPAIKANIRTMVKVVRDLKDLSPMVGNRRANAQYARKVLKWINEGEKLFENPPDGAMLEKLFASRQTAPVNSLERLEAVAWEARAWRQDWLISLRSRCEWIIADKIGEPATVGNKQRKAAIAARGLCKMASKPLAWSSPTSAYRRTAGLLFEAMTGEYDRELEYACEWAAKIDTEAK
jgi:hypothetical protein